MRKFIVLISFVVSTEAYSQSFRGKVVDATTGDVLEYAHVGIVGKNIGGIAWRNGEFSIDLGNAGADDLIRVSYIGYESYSAPVGSLDLTKHETIKLQPLVYELNPVEVSATSNTYKFGNQKAGRTFTGWGDFQSLRGRTRGLLIEEMDCPARIKTFSFRINHNDWDSVAFRLNFLSVENGEPGTSILQQNIVITTSRRHKWVHIDLHDYNILVCSKAIVTLEWVDAWGPVGEYSNLLTLSRSKNSGLTYRREPGEERGSCTHDENALAMFLEVYGD